MMGTARRARDILHDEGIVSLARSSKQYASATLQDQWLRYKYKRQYGAIAPRPNERLWVDPATLDYSIAAGSMYDDDREYPRYGVLDGSWDENKNSWRESRVWWGLRNRFVEDIPWEETHYYQYAANKIESGGSVGYLDGPQTMANLRAYLDELDDLYEDIRDNGYDPSSIISVHIGRDGEWIVGHGNHRRTIASVLGIESVPVRVKFRHAEWQDRRRRFHRADSPDELPENETVRSHPDLPDVTS